MKIIYLIKRKCQKTLMKTINDLNMVEQMNNAQLNTDPETGDELPETAIPTNHTYKLRPRPTERNKKYTMTQAGQQSTNKELRMPRVHMMMAQINVRDGIKNMAIKELRHCSKNSTNYMSEIHYCH